MIDFYQNMNKVFKNIIAIYIISACLEGQEIPNEFFDYQVRYIQNDTLKLNSTTSAFGPFRFLSIQGSNYGGEEHYFHNRIGTKIINKDSHTSYSIYNYTRYKFKKHYYAYLYSRVVNNTDEFSRFTGIAQDIKRYGFISGENDLSGIGFENEFIILQIGRGRQSWGAGNGINIVLNESAPAYDHLLIDFNMGKIRTRYFHGFLENIDRYNRYITGKGIEFKYRHNIIFSLSEISIYSGVNRSLDFSYFNPISSHLEIEFNNRSNKEGTDSGNAVWQSSLDYYIKSNLRISANYVIDELVLDQTEIDSGKINGIAYSLRLAWTPIISHNILTFDASLIRVGKHTFKHEDGYNNFVTRNRPLGWKYGSDGEQIELGGRYYISNKLISRIAFGQISIGKSIINNPYEPYTDYSNGSWPSSPISKDKYFRAIIKWWVKPNVIFESELNIYNKKSINDSHLKLGLNVFLPFSWFN